VYYRQIFNFLGVALDLDKYILPCWTCFLWDSY